MLQYEVLDEEEEEPVFCYMCGEPSYPCCSVCMNRCDGCYEVFGIDDLTGCDEEVGPGLTAAYCKKCIKAHLAGLVGPSHVG